ncbi:hypothetical protein DE146DRAFT_626915 [Phaeosphaeria sp. MPI-PUGE-AT-0046c]|nr:hypothetical protein DE146DRAFT_626915 [Phaeosphaeria sp. MPI-PUGE-AT-0046c]
MSRPKVLIVGCGAVGLTHGYILSPSADITFLVRPGRKSAFVAPKHLYDYKEDALRTFSTYRVVESASEVSGETFAFIFDTLDGNTARSESGVATIASVGNLLNEPQNVSSFLLFDAIGLDIDEHYARTARIPVSRLILVMSLLAHQPTPQISVPTTASKDLVEKADMFYVDSMSGVGLIVPNSQPKLIDTLEAIYNVNGKFKIKRIPAIFSPIVVSLAMLHLVVWNIDGFKPFPELRKNTELWGLMMRAQTEILRLPRYGWTGWILSLVMGSWATMQMNMPAVEGAKPMQYHEFNAFHHGGKVAKQDRRILEEILIEGEKAGKKMGGLGEVVRRAAQLQ